MKCLNPIYVKSMRKVVDNYFNERTVWMPDRRTGKLWREVPCGKCFACQSNRRNAWVFRLCQERKVATTAYFVTFTYDDDHLHKGSKNEYTLCKEEVQKFLKKFRDRVVKEYKKLWKERGMKYHEYKDMRPPRMKYFLVGEYGSENERPHYHMDLFNFPFGTDDCERLVRETWKNCEVVHVRNLTNSLINYTTKYMLKQFFFPDDYEERGIEPVFILTSKGLGIDFAKNFDHAKYFVDTLNTSYPLDGGYRYSIPRYHREKLWKTYVNDSRCPLPFGYYDDLYHMYVGDKIADRATFFNNEKDMRDRMQFGENYEKIRRERRKNYVENQLIKLKNK